jgi:hypothetical protein
MRSLTLLLWLVTATFAVTAAHAQASPIHRCVDAQGHQVFTDRRCVDMQATPTLPPANIPAATAPVGSPAPSAAPQLCAASEDALRQQVVDAFAAHDPNRIAGLMLWTGYSERAVVDDIQSLRSLVQYPLIDIDGGSSPASSEAPDLYDASQPLSSLLATPSSGPRRASAPPTDQLVLVTGAGDGSGSTRETRFSLSRQSGCVWMLPPD